MKNLLIEKRGCEARVWLTLVFVGSKGVETLFKDGHESRYTYAADGRDYCGNYIYKNGCLERVMTENGYIQDGGLYFYIKDYQGNVRVVLNQANQPVEVNSYYPYGGLMAATTTEGTQPYKYSTKELDRENGLDWYDSKARMYDPTIGRTPTQDPMAEKYYSISPYLWCAANPIAYIDPNGEKIYVSNEYVDLFLEDLQAVFGEYTSGFSFNDGYLQYTGSNKGMTKEQRELLKGIISLMESTETTVLLYTDHLIISDASGAEKVLSSGDSGGEGTLLMYDNPQLDKNIVYISPSPANCFTVEEVLPNYYNTYDKITRTIHSNGFRNFNKSNVRTNRSDLLFHSFGHIIYAGKPQNKVIDFNNLARKSLNLPKRKYDEDHNSLKI